MVTLATSSGVVADVGCDHGLLAWGLSMSGRFDSVIGVDQSEQALQQGALALLEQEQPPPTKLEFILGNGLEPLEAPVDTICVAGVGVHTMMQEILTCSELDRIGCQQVVVQPTNSRPRHLMMLYEHLALSCGFQVDREHIEFLSKRWYLSTSFQRQNNTSSSIEPQLSGLTLECHKDPEQRRIYQDYVEHHVRWLEGDEQQQKGTLQEPNDRLWLETMRRPSN